MIGQEKLRSLQEKTGDLAIEMVARFLPHGDAIASLGEHNHELARMIIKSDDEAARFGENVLRNLVIATQNERIAQQLGLRNRSDCLSYLVTLRSIEKVADHAAGIADNL